uniref:Uncharacterized protein n=1 Tax=Populus alba TaxID=43335 RepID=A0A4U5M4I3_POPAL|nr:hypothetical protein D5086_0000320860 [Populus alba]
MKSKPSFRSSFPGLHLKSVHEGQSSKKKEKLIRQSYAIIKSVVRGQSSISTEKNHTAGERSLWEVTYRSGFHSFLVNEGKHWADLLGTKAPTPAYSALRFGKGLPFTNCSLPRFIPSPENPQNHADNLMVKTFGLSDNARKMLDLKPMLYDMTHMESPGLIKSIA